MPTDPKYLATVAARRAANRAAGVCTECGEPRAPHDPRLCAKHRAKARKYHRTTYARTVGHMPRTAIVSHPPREPGAVCAHCYDLPHQRPRSGCPRCGKPYRARESVAAAIAVERRTSSWPWD
jgi:hypothetical protein